MSALWRRLAGGCSLPRPALLLTGLLLVLGLALPAEVRGQGLSPLDPEETELLRLVNLERQHLELPLLRREARLERAMTLHVEWMAQSRILSHTGQAGSSPFQRAMAQGYEPGALGEVIARGQRTAQDVLLGRRCDWTCNTVCDASQRCGGWRQSPPHWAIITDGRYRDLGLSRVSASSGGQTYWGMLLGLDPLSAKALAPTATVAAATATATATATSSAIASATAPATATVAPSATASRSPTTAPSPTATSTPSPRPSATASPAPSASHTPSATVGASASPRPSATPPATLTRTPSATPSATATATPTRTPMPSPSSTPTRTATPASTPTASRTVTPSPSRTASRTATASPSAVPSATATRTAVPTASRTATTSPSASATLARPSATASVTPRPSATPALSGEVQGEVHVQGRGACGGTLILVDGGLGDVTGADCRFSLRGLRPGGHRIEAWRQGWLARERWVEVGGPQALNLPAVWLPAGDLTGDDWVDVQDLMMADLARGSCRGQAGWEALADVDGNGCVDLSDRIWVEMNQGLAGPLAW